MTTVKRVVKGLTGMDGKDIKREENTVVSKKTILNKYLDTNNQQSIQTKNTVATILPNFIPFETIHI